MRTASDSVQSEQARERDLHQLTQLPNVITNNFRKGISQTHERLENTIRLFLSLVFL